MRSPIYSLATLLTLLATLATHPSPTAAADNKTAARNLLVEGSDLLKSGEYSQALAKFQAAFDMVPSPKIHYNFGLAYQGLGRPAEALGAFQKFVTEAQDVPAANVTKAKQFMADLRTKVAWLDVTGDVRGAEISVDGRALGTGPLAGETAIDPGVHQVTVEAPGKPPFLQKISPTAGEKVRVVARLAAETPAPAFRPGAPRLVEASRAVDDPAPTPGTADPVAPDDSSPRQWQRPAAWVGVGVSALLVTYGVMQALKANSKFNEFNTRLDPDDPTKSACNKQKSDSGAVGCKDLLDAGNLATSRSVIGFVGGGVAVGAAVLFLTAPSPSGNRTLACAPTLAMPGGFCTWRF